MPAAARFELPTLPRGYLQIVGNLRRLDDKVHGRGSTHDVAIGKAQALKRFSREILANNSAPDLVGNVLLPIVENESGLSSVVEQKRVVTLAGVWLGEDRQRQRGQELLTALAYFPSEVAEVPPYKSKESVSSWRNHYLSNMIGWLFTERYLTEFLRDSRDSLLLAKEDNRAVQAVERISYAVWSRVNDERRAGKAVLGEAGEREEKRDIFLPFLASAHVGADAKRHMAYVVLDQTLQEQDSEIPDLFFWHAMGGIALSEEDKKRIEARFSSGASDGFLLKRIALTALSDKNQEYIWLRLGNIIASRGDMKFVLPLAYRLVPGVAIDPTVGRGICMALNGILRHEANREEWNMAVGINQAMDLAVAAMELCVRVEGKEQGVWQDQQEMVKLLRTLHTMYPAVIMREGERVWSLMEYFLRSAHHEDLEKELAYFREIIYRDAPVPALESAQPDFSDAYLDIVALSFQLDESQLEEKARERISLYIASADGGLAADDLTADEIEMWRVLISRVVAPSGRVEFLAPLARRLQDFSRQADQLTSTGIYNSGVVCSAIATIVEHRLIESRQVMSDEDTVRLISAVLLIYEKKGISTIDTTVRILGLIHTLLGDHPEVAGNNEFCGKLLQAFPDEPDTAYGTDGFSEADLIGYIRQTIESYRSRISASSEGNGHDIE